MPRLTTPAKVMIVLLSQLCFSLKLKAQTAPQDFLVIDINTELAGDVVGFAFFPDGRILVINQFSGNVQLIVNGSLGSQPILTVPDLATSSEKGLLGIAIDPGFPDQPYVYLFHSHNSSTNRVSRFTLDGDLQNPNSTNLTIDVLSQLTLIDDMPAQAFNHNGGSLRFGSDATLYISHGDDANSSLVQDLTTLNGKILRINRDGSIPADNPVFPDEPAGKRGEIFAFGLRNPFRFAIDPETDSLFIGDVGQISFEEFDLSAGGENFGWPHYEGNVIFDSNAPLILPDPAFPIFDYARFPGSNSGMALVAYRQQNFSTDFSFPPEFEGTFFYADFFQDWIRNLRPDGEGDWLSVDFASGFSSPVDGYLAPDGSIYILEYGNALKQIIYNPTVPVELSSFSVQQVNDKVVLQWTIESGTNNFGFEIQKSINGKNFDKIGFVPGDGTTSERTNYTFEDREFRVGKIFYRLKQIDTDGGFEFSSTISIEIAAPNEFKLTQNFPNPFNPNTKIFFNIADTRHTTLTIYDILGNEVIRLLYEKMAPGKYTINWGGKNRSGEAAPSGVYVYTLKSGQFKQSRKMILVR